MRRALVAAVALMLLIVPALASAAGPNAQWADQRAPSARVQASGSGLMTVAGRLSVNGQIPERGVVDQGPQGRRPGLPGRRAARAEAGRADPGAPGLGRPLRHRLE